MKRAALALATALVVGAGAGLLFPWSSAPAQEALSASAPAPARAPRALEIGGARHAVAPKRRPPTTHDARTTIRIARLGLEEQIHSPSRLDSGPSWWPVTGRPGGGDTIAIAGHRTTHTRPFYFLERLRRGDRLEITYRGRRHVYRVVRNRVFSAANLHIADAVGYERVLLSACTPRGSAESRLVVEARPV